MNVKVLDRKRDSKGFQRSKQLSAMSERSVHGKTRLVHRCLLCGLLYRSFADGIIVLSNDTQVVQCALDRLPIEVFR